MVMRWDQKACTRTLVWMVIAGGTAIAGVLTKAESIMDPASLRQIFVDAGTAFDEGRYADAEEGYHELLALQVVTPEILFNLGNTYYRMNDIGQAVLAFRRAWRLTPRDDDIQANMRLAMQKTSAVMRQASSIHQLLHILSREEWHALATGLWWGLWGTFGLGATVPKTRSVAIRFGCLQLLVLVFALYSIHEWSNRLGIREYVVTHSGVQALFGPLEDAEPYFSLPAGSILLLEEFTPPWAKISIEDREGWILEDSITPVVSR